MKQIKFRMTDQQNFRDAIEISENNMPIDNSMKIELLRRVFSKEKCSHYRMLRVEDDHVDFKSANDEISIEDGLNDNPRIGNIVGVVRELIEMENERYDVTVEIHSRFDNEDNSYFIRSLIFDSEILYDVAKIPEDIDNKLVHQGSFCLSDFLIGWSFAIKLLRAYENGVYCCYEDREYNDDRVCGTLDVNRHIRQNSGRNNMNVAYVKRERMQNNALNRLILCTHNFLREKHYYFEEKWEKNPDYSKAIGDICSAINGEYGNAAKCIYENQKPISSPYYTEYESLRQLCIYILTEEYGDIYGGNGNDEIHGILLYIPDLWELFLKKQFSKYIPYICKYQENYKLDDMKISKYFENRYNPDMLDYLYNVNRKALKINTIRPDYVFCDKEHPDNSLFVLDAKHIKKERVYSSSDCFPKLWRDIELIKFIMNKKAEYKIMIPYSPLGGLIFPIKQDESVDEGSYFEFAETLQLKCYAIVVPQVPAGSESDYNYNNWKVLLDENIREIIKVKLCNDIQASEERMNICIKTGMNYR